MNAHFTHLGQLCFCKSPDCNRASQKSSCSITVLCTALLVGWLVGGWSLLGTVDNSSHDYLIQSHANLSISTIPKKASTMTSNKMSRQVMDKRKAKRSLSKRRRGFTGHHGIRSHGLKTRQRSSQKKTKVI